MTTKCFCGIAQIAPSLFKSAGNEKDLLNVIFFDAIHLVCCDEDP